MRLAVAGSGTNARNNRSSSFLKRDMFAGTYHEHLARRNLFSGPSIEEDPAVRHELQQVVVVADVCREECQAKPLGLEKQDTILQCAKPGSLAIALQAAENTGQQCCATKRIQIGHEDSVSRHCSDEASDFRGNRLRFGMPRVKHSYRAHEFLSSDR